MRITYVLIILLSLHLNSCASGPTPEQRARWAKENAAQKDNTDKFVEIFMSKIWNKSPLEISGSNTWQRSATMGQTSNIKSLRQFLKYENLSSIKNMDFGYDKNFADCNDLSRPMPLSVATKVDPARNKKTQKISWYQSSFYLGYEFNYKNKFDGSKGKKICRPPYGPDNMYVLGGSSGFRTRIDNAWAIQKKLVANGVPLVFCYEPKDPNKRFAEKFHSKFTVVNCSIDIGSFLGCKRGYCMKGSASVVISTHKNDYFQVFQLKNLRLKTEDLSKTLSEIYQKRFQDPEYVKKVGHYFSRLKGESNQAYQNRMAKYDAIEADERAYQRKLDESQAAMIHSSLSQGIKNIKNSKPVGLASPQVQAIGNRNNYLIKNSPANKYIPKGQPKPYELQNRFHNWCSSGGGSINASTGKCSNRTGVSKATAKADPYLADKAACLQKGRKWLGDRCDSVINKTTFPGRAGIGATAAAGGTVGVIKKSTSASDKKLAAKKCYPIFGEFVPGKYDKIKKRMVPNVEGQKAAKRKWELALAKLTPECRKKSIEMSECKKDPKCRSKSTSGGKGIGK